MKSIEDLQAHLGELPIFPLPEAVFFPHTRSPLHIFEPRYRQLVRDALAFDGPLAMALLYDDGSLDRFGRPRVHDVACAGFISDSRELEDGRYLIELSGAARVRIQAEHPPLGPYRRVQAALLAELLPDPRSAAQRLQTLRLLAHGLEPLSARAAVTLTRLLEGQRSAACASDVVADSLFADPEVRQRLLENLDPLGRLDLIIDHLSEALAQMDHLSSSPSLN